MTDAARNREIAECSAELERQQSHNGKLLDLLRRVSDAMPDAKERIGPMIMEAERTRGILDEAAIMIRTKSVTPPPATGDEDGHG